MFIVFITTIATAGLSSTACRKIVAPSACGNGIVEGDEQCDDGNTTDIDGCSSMCLSEAVCGNGVVEPGEQCDDGNTVDDDGCQADCRWPKQVCKTLEPLASGVCEVVPGDDSRLLVGDVLASEGILGGGEVLVDATGQITCTGCDCASQAAGATVIRCPSGVISPGLINSHDHITYTQNDPYNDTGERYEHRHDWRRGLNGHTEITGTSGGATADQIRWGELRFLLGGTTSTVGSGSATGFLRNLDRSAQEGLNQPPVHYQTFPLGDSNGTQLASGCGYPGIDTGADIAGDDAYFPHIAEGVDAYARNEFTCVSSTDNGGHDLLEPQSAFIHSIGLEPTDYAQMAGQGTSLIWSPRSNITLYGNTAVVSVAARMGVRIALGTDWMPTGSMNMQRELQCADSFNRTYLDNFFNDRELWRMATLYGAQAAAVDDAVGALDPGLTADIAIFDGSVNPDYRAIIDAGPGDTTLVLRGGQVLYGDDALVSALTAGNCDILDACGVNKRVCVMDDLGVDFAALEASAGNSYPLFYCGEPVNEPSCTPSRPSSVNGSTTYSGQPSASDMDGDGIADTIDNCPSMFNPVRPVDDSVQADFDMDGEGDVCDQCPLDADTTDCQPFDNSDLDNDGVVNEMDNCPRDPNPDQADVDADNKGDACDPCPMVGNPGALACPVSVYDIKQGLASGQVAVDNALVTACSTGSGYFLQIKPGDPGYNGPDYSGIYVYETSIMCGIDVTPGDRVTLNPATVSDFFGQIQLGSAAITVNASGEALPDAILVTSATAGGVVATSLESVLVKVETAVVTEIEPPAGPGDSNPNNEFVVDGALRVNDFLYLADLFPVVGTTYQSITGVLDYRNGYSKLEPRDSADLVLGAPVLIGFAPTLSYAREGVLGAPTIPTPLTVTLSGPAEADTLVTITSSDPTSVAVVGSGVTVPLGASSATVLIDALQATPSATLSATLDSNTLTADVRVVGAGELAQLAYIDPPGVAVAPLGTVSLSVFLDIPADSILGETIALSLSPGTAGSVPASLTVLPDQISASFLFTAGAAPGTEVVTATLGGSMVSATIDVTTGGGLIINEVNYDDVNLDSEEYVEILNITAAPMDLANITLVFINGNGNAEYSRVDLAPAGTLAPGQYLVVGTSTLINTVPPTAKTIALPAADNNIQNGAPDALGLVDLSADELLDALSYEGSITAGSVNGVGTFNFVEGTATTVMDENAIDGSLIRSPNGTDTDDAASDWAFTTTKTPGTANVP